MLPEADTLAVASRSLLQQSMNAISPAPAEAVDECAQPDGDQQNYLDLRIGGLFIIMVVSSLGIIIPMLGRRFTSALFLARAFGSGVILATALVHVLVPALMSLQSPCLGWSTEYPWAMAIAGYTALLTFVVEYWIGAFLSKRFGIDRSAALPSPLDIEVQPDSIAAEKPDARRKLNATVTSYTLEAGIIVHSVFVGLAYGASTDLNTIRALTIALGFHQGVEGISLACSYLDAGFSKLKYFLLGSAFILITPIGIAMGLGLGNSYKEGSKAALGVQGTLDSVAAGILLYNAFADLLLPTFVGHEGGGHSHGGHEHTGLHGAPRSTRLTLTGMLCLFVGAGLQDLIGKWV